MNSLFFIGAGPGDPQLLTLQGAAALEKSGFVYLSPPFEQSFASLLRRKEVLFPFDYSFEELVEMIQGQLISSPVAF